MSQNKTMTETHLGRTVGRTSQHLHKNKNLKKKKGDTHQRCMRGEKQNPIQHV